MAEDQLQERGMSGPATEQGPECKTPAPRVSPHAQRGLPSSRPPAKMLLGAWVLEAAVPPVMKEFPLAPLS